MDGLSVWLRETKRPEDERSPSIIQHEMDRAGRLVDHWETAIDHPWMRESFNLAQITLVCALGLEARFPFRWREGHARLRDWFDRLAARPSFAKTVPPEGH
jgi:glutathione S-transferase